jgi:UPF0755 protein
VAKKNRKKPSFIKRIFIIVIIGIIIIIGIKGYQFYKGVEEPNVNLNGKEVEYIYIPTGSDFNDVLHLLTVNKLIIHTKTFEWVAEKKGYIDNVKPGKYKIRADMSNNALMNLLRSGKQEPVRLVFNKVRTKERFAGIIAEQIEADSIDLLTKLNDSKYLKTYNKNLETALTLFIPNTYELYWNTTAEGFVDRMYKEYTRFWNNSRLQKAKNLNMSTEEIFTLASIMDGGQASSRGRGAAPAGLTWRAIEPRSFGLSALTSAPTGSSCGASIWRFTGRRRCPLIPR